MVKLLGAFSQISDVKVAVVGDFIYDMYTIGKVRRISPEAPVPVLHVEKEEGRPGGAGNVALNLISLGAQVKVIGRVGSDFHGQSISDHLKQEGVDVSGLMIDNKFQTTLKNRVIADSQQILRIDFEKSNTLHKHIEQEVIANIPILLTGVQIVAISDYGKGFLSKAVLQTLIQYTRDHQIIVIVDPKGDDFSKYEGATILKPNLQEVYAASRKRKEATLDEVASAIFKEVNIGTLVVTRSESGISMFTAEGVREDFPVRIKEVTDVTGAGDTVLAVLSVALGSGIELSQAVQLANVAAGVAIERIGCARVTLADMAERLLELNVENKIFDERHLFALQEALKESQYIVLRLPSGNSLSKEIFHHIRTLSVSKQGKKLIVYLKDKNPDMEFVHLLSSLSEIDFVVLKDESLRHLCQEIHPDQVWIMEQDKLLTLNHYQALLQEIICDEIPSSSSVL